MSVLSTLSPYKLAIEIAVIGSLAVGAVGGIHLFLEHERDIGRAEVQSRWDAQVVKDKEAAAKQEKQWGAQKDTAQTDGAKRDETIRTLANSVAVASGGLRDAIAKTNRGMPGYSVDALRETSRIYGELLAECSARRRSVAEEAERLNSEKRTLIEAWPTVPAAK